WIARRLACAGIRPSIRSSCWSAACSGRGSTRSRSASPACRARAPVTTVAASGVRKPRWRMSCTRCSMTGSLRWSAASEPDFDEPGPPPLFPSSSPPNTSPAMRAAMTRATVRFPAVRSARHPAELATGDVERLAVDVVRPRRAEDEDAARGLLRRRAPAERDQHRRHLPHLLGDAELDLLAATLDRLGALLGGGQARLDEAEGHGVHVDLELAPLLGERLREAHDAGLRRRVVHLAGVPHRPGDRADVDDLPEDLATLLPLLLRRLAQVGCGGAEDPER